VPAARRETTWLKKDEAEASTGFSETAGTKILCRVQKCATIRTEEEEEEKISFLFSFSFSFSLRLLLDLAIFPPWFSQSY
jgi:hypothetical protein